METGNPKQVAVLAVMAVGAIGFLLLRVIGGKGLPLAALAAGANAAGPKVVVETVGSPLLADPFSHPKLAPIKAAVTDESTVAAVTVGPTMAGGSLPMVGNFGAPAVGPLAPSDKTEISSAKDEKAEPAKPVVPEGTLVALEAIAGSSDAVAFLAVDGKESQPFRPNDSIKGKVRLLRVEDGAVVLSGPKGELTINVGERKRI